MKDEELFSILIPNKDKHIVGDGRLIIELHEVKMYGRTWRFNLNDNDPFPSKPHGHDYENGDKLNVFTGEIYNKNKQRIGKLSIKQLKHLQIKLNETPHKIY